MKYDATPAERQVECWVSAYQSSREEGPYTYSPISATKIYHSLAKAAGHYHITGPI
jgi:hypothetical protein